MSCALNNTKLFLFFRFPCSAGFDHLFHSCGVRFLFPFPWCQDWLCHCVGLLCKPFFLACLQFHLCPSLSLPLAVSLSLSLSLCPSLVLLSLSLSLLSLSFFIALSPSLFRSRCLSVSFFAPPFSQCRLHYRWDLWSFFAGHALIPHSSFLSFLLVILEISQAANALQAFFAMEIALSKLRSP